MSNSIHRYAIALALACSTASAHAEDKLPSPRGFLFWSPAEQIVGYRNIEKVFPTHVIARGDKVYPLPKADRELDVRYTYKNAPWTTADFMKANNVAGLLAVKDGKIVLERYALGETENDRWTSFSVGKSVTSTLVGAAIKDGYIKSLDAPVTDYIAELKGGAYDGVTVRELLTMTSGVKWNEDYADPHSDVNTLGTLPAKQGESLVVSYMAKLPREAAPGTKFVYKTGESDLMGVLVSRATHKTLADYLSEKVWSQFGMERDAVWMLDSSGEEFGGCCISMTLKDYGRFGLFFLNGGLAGSKAVVPDGWTKEATSPAVAKAEAIYGYGFQWWTLSDGSYEAIGIFGQMIHIDPKKNLIIVTSSAWPNAGDREHYVATHAFVEAVSAAVR